MRDGLVIAAADGRISADRERAPAGRTRPRRRGAGQRSRRSCRSSTCTSTARRSPAASSARSTFRAPSSMRPSTRRAKKTSAARSSSRSPPAAKSRVVQIAGLIARRIVTFSREGDSVASASDSASFASARASMSICRRAASPGQRRAAGGRRRNGVCRSEVRGARARGAPRLIQRDAGAATKVFDLNSS